MARFRRNVLQDQIKRGPVAPRADGRFAQPEVLGGVKCVGLEAGKFGHQDILRL